MMMHAKLAVAAVAAVFALGTAQAAQTAKQDLAEMSKAKVTLTDAMRLAEHEANGRATEAKFKPSGKGNTAGAYEVKVLSNNGDKLMGYTVDAASGHITSAGNEPFEKVFTHLTAAEIAGVQTTLSSAIGMAEQKTGGRAIDAEVSRKGEHVRYDIEVAKDDGTTSHMRIDGATGHLASLK
jgi:uncharacterized membrane protein YkoI